MGQAQMSRRIIMNFSTPPAPEDVHAVAITVLDTIPEELAEFVDDMDLITEEFPAQELLDEMEAESEFDILALYRDTEEKIPGVIAKGVNAERRLVIFRRPILDLWCDTGEDFVAVIRNVVVSEVAQANGFDENEIEALCAAAAAASSL